jgi:hypothetical protein
LHAAWVNLDIYVRCIYHTPHPSQLLLLLLLLTGDDWAAVLENFDTSLDAQVVAAPSKEEQELAAAKALVSSMTGAFGDCLGIWAWVALELSETQQTHPKGT